MDQEIANNSLYIYNIAPCFWPTKYWLLKTDEDRDKWKKDHRVELGTC